MIMLTIFFFFPVKNIVYTSSETYQFQKTEKELRSQPTIGVKNPPPTKKQKLLALRFYNCLLLHIITSLLWQTMCACLKANVLVVRPK